MVISDFEGYYIEAISENDAWKLCDFVVANSDRLKRFFPKTLEQNLTPDLSKNFTEKKVKQFRAQEEFLFKLIEKEQRTIAGLVFIKELDWQKKQAELAYCLGYQYEGKGWTTQNIKAISDYAIYELGLKILRIIVHKSNIGSIRVAEKCGYIWKELLIAEHTPSNAAPLDMELYELKA